MSDTLHTTTSQLESLLAAHDKTQRTSTTVKVDKQALINVLMDHHKMFSLCKDRVKEPSPTYTSKEA
jgi:hypothetical protein